MSIILLPQSPQLSSSQESANRGGFISSNLRDAIKEGGEELDVGGRALPKQLPLRVPSTTGLSPEVKSTGLSRDPPKPPSPLPHAKGKPQHPWKSRGARGAAEGKERARGSPRGWKVLRGGLRLGVTPVSARNKTSPERGAAVSPRLMNGPKNRFPVYRTRNRFWGRGHLGAIFTSSCPPLSRAPGHPRGPLPRCSIRLPRGKGAAGGMEGVMVTATASASTPSPTTAGGETASPGCPEHPRNGLVGDLTHGVLIPPLCFPRSKKILGKKKKKKRYFCTQDLQQTR